MKTAKELKQSHLVEYWVETKSDLVTQYVFSDGELETFCELLCQEQKEKCYEALKPRFEGRNNISKIHEIMIMDALMPEL